ncbi:zf-HC2 domain-containing protein [Gordonia sp. NPDC003424]
MAREALSARIDGENEGVPAARVDQHVAGCAECRAWYATATAQAETMSAVAPGPSADPTDAILTRVAQARPSSTQRRRERLSDNVVRIGLTCAGVAQIIVAMLQMTGDDFGMMSGHAGTTDGTHLMNETTAWAMALGVCMVVAAWWQRALAGLLVVLTVFTVVLAGYVISDAVDGEVTLARILSHLPVLVGLGFAAWGVRPGNAVRDPLRPSAGT